MGLIGGNWGADEFSLPADYKAPKRKDLSIEERLILALVFISKRGGQPGQFTLKRSRYLELELSLGRVFTGLVYAPWGKLKVISRAAS